MRCKILRVTPYCSSEFTAVSMAHKPMKTLKPHVIGNELLIISYIRMTQLNKNESLAQSDHWQK